MGQSKTSRETGSCPDDTVPKRTERCNAREADVHKTPYGDVLKAGEHGTVRFRPGSLPRVRDKDVELRSRGPYNFIKLERAKNVGTRFASLRSRVD